jgi:hypothetical protein
VGGGGKEDETVLSSKFRVLIFVAQKADRMRIYLFFISKECLLGPLKGKIFPEEHLDTEY